MFNFDSIIDTVQGAQKSFVETYVTDKKVQADLVKLVDSQAKFTKTTYKNTLELVETAVKNFNEIVYKKVGA
jgi:hypothetical protein